MKHKVMLKDEGKGRSSEFSSGVRVRVEGAGLLRVGGRGNEKRKTLGESTFSVTKDVKTGSNSGRPRTRTL